MRVNHWVFMESCESYPAQDTSRLEYHFIFVNVNVSIYVELNLSYDISLLMRIGSRQLSEAKLEGVT